MNRKKRNRIILASGITAAILLLLLFACNFSIILQEADNTGLVFLDHDKMIYGIDPDDNEVRVIYETAFFPGGIAESNGRLYVGNYLSKTAFGNVRGQSIQVIESDGSAGEYFDTVPSPGGLVVQGDYLFVGSHYFSASTGEAYYIIHNKDSLEAVCEGRYVRGLLDKLSVVEYEDGFLLTLGSCGGTGDGRIYDLGGEDLAVTATWTVDDYPSLSNSSGLMTNIHDEKLFITSTAEETISIIPLPPGSEDETVIDVMELLGEDNDTNENFYLKIKGTINNKYYGFISEYNGPFGIIFTLNLDTMEIELKKEMDNKWEEIPTTDIVITDDKLYTYIQGDCNSSVPDDEDVIWVYSLEDFSFIKEISLDPDQNNSRVISLE